MWLKLAFNGFLSRPARQLLTGACIAVGVAAVTAVFMFADGLRITFEQSAEQSETGYDIAIRSKDPFGGTRRSSQVDAVALPVIESVEGVSAIQPRIIDFSVVAIDDNGKSALANNSPNLGVNWQRNNPNAWLVEGAEPTEPNQFALDVDSFTEGAFVIGQPYMVNTPAGSVELTLSGTFNYNEPDTNQTFGAKVVALEEQTAVRLLNNNIGYDDITLLTSGNPLVTQVALQQQLDLQGDGLRAQLPQTIVNQQQSDLNQIVALLRTVLLVFAGIVLLVSSFLINNVFTITVNQRVREFGTLRALGASGNQLVRVLIGEATILGVAAVGVGIPAGLVLARILRLGLTYFGFLGTTPLPLQTRTLVLASIVGLGVTIAAAIVPAIAARRITPMAAIRSEGTTMAAKNNLLAATVNLTIAGGLVIALYIARGPLLLMTIPLLTALFGSVGLASLGRLGRVLAPLALCAYAGWIINAVWFSGYTQAETFTLLGAGAFLSIVAISRLSRTMARPFSFLAGHYPTAIVVWICGAVTTVLSGLTAPSFLNEDSFGYLRNGYLPVITGVLLAMSYLFFRTARGSLGITGKLARQNAARNPARTATTATALMVGLALVASVTVVGESIKVSLNNSLETAARADWFVQGPQTGEFSLAFSVEAGDRLAEVPEIAEIARYRFSATAFAVIVPEPNTVLDTDTMTQAAPELLTAIEFEDDEALDALRSELGIQQVDVEASLGAELSKLDRHIGPQFVERNDLLAADGPGIYLAESVAAERGLSVGDQFITVFADGRLDVVTITGIYVDNLLLGRTILSLDVWDQYLPSGSDSFLTALSAPGANPNTTEVSLKTALGDDYSNLTILRPEGVVQQGVDQTNRALAAINVLLAFASALAVVGIAIALTLTVHERRREIALLRAVGAQKHQIRWTVRWEGVIVGLFGGFFGTVAGIGLGVVAVAKLPDHLVSATAIPVDQLLIYVPLVAATGMGAGIVPAWIASRLIILENVAST